jgi:hypothetical protein
MNALRTADTLARVVDALDNVTSWLTCDDADLAAELARAASELHALRLEIERAEIANWRAVPA